MRNKGALNIGGKNRISAARCNAGASKVFNPPFYLIIYTDFVDGNSKDAG
jgi:hypothetical protein